MSSFRAIFLFVCLAAMMGLAPGSDLIPDETEWIALHGPASVEIPSLSIILMEEKTTGGESTVPGDLFSGHSLRRIARNLADPKVPSGEGAFFVPELDLLEWFIPCLHGKQHLLLSGF